MDYEKVFQDGISPFRNTKFFLRNTESEINWNSRLEKKCTYRITGKQYVGKYLNLGTDISFTCHVSDHVGSTLSLQQKSQHLNSPVHVRGGE